MSQKIDLTQYRNNDYDFTNHIMENEYLTEEQNNTHSDTKEENENLIKSLFPNKLLLSINEAAKLLGVSYDYLRNNTCNGKIAHKQFGRRRMIHIIELTRLLTEGIN